MEIFEHVLFLSKNNLENAKRRKARRVSRAVDLVDTTISHGCYINGIQLRQRLPSNIMTYSKTILFYFLNLQKYCTVQPYLRKLKRINIYNTGVLLLTLPIPTGKQI